MQTISVTVHGPVTIDLSKECEYKVFAYFVWSQSMESGFDILGLANIMCAFD